MCCSARRTPTSSVSGDHHSAPPHAPSARAGRRTSTARSRKRLHGRNRQQPTSGSCTARPGRRAGRRGNTAEHDPGDGMKRGRRRPPRSPAASAAHNRRFLRQRVRRRRWSALRGIEASHLAGPEPSCRPADDDPSSGWRTNAAASERKLVQLLDRAIGKRLTLAGLVEVATHGQPLGPPRRRAGRVGARHTVPAVAAPAILSPRWRRQNSAIASAMSLAPSSRSELEVLDRVGAGPTPAIVYSARCRWCRRRRP